MLDFLKDSQTFLTAKGWLPFVCVCVRRRKVAPIVRERRRRNRSCARVLKPVVLFFIVTQFQLRVRERDERDNCRENLSATFAGFQTLVFALICSRSIRNENREPKKYKKTMLLQLLFPQKTKGITKIGDSPMPATEISSSRILNA